LIKTSKELECKAFHAMYQDGLWDIYIGLIVVCMSLLYVVDSADFIFLMNQTGLTWGNLSAHMSKLEEAGYLEVEKTFRGKRPNTTLRLTTRGREAFRKYAGKMKQVFRDFDG
jgi:DNA-binding MarR family transcriptional regulator